MNSNDDMDFIREEMRIFGKLAHDAAEQALGKHYMEGKQAAVAITPGVIAMMNEIDTIRRAVLAEAEGYYASLEAEINAAEHKQAAAEDAVKRAKRRAKEDTVTLSGYVREMYDRAERRAMRPYDRAVERGGVTDVAIGQIAADVATAIREEMLRELRAAEEAD